MPKKMPGIADEKGRPKVALAGEYIGAEHANAATDWTRRYQAAATHEHDDSGRHNRGYHCIGALQLMMPAWSRGGTLEAEAKILSGQLYEHDYKTYPGNLFLAGAASMGRVRVTMDVPAPANYFVQVGNAPQPFPYGDLGGASVGRRIFRIERISSNVFEIYIDVLAGGLPLAQMGSIRSPITLRIYGARRPTASGGPLADYVRHRLVEGGLGEVIPAEMYQAVADFQRASVDHLSLNHHREWNGVPSHRGQRWFSAVAHIEIVDGDSRLETEPELRTYFAFGFRKAPRIRAESRTIHGVNFMAWWLDWQTLSENARGFYVNGRMRDGNGAWEPLGPGEMISGVGWCRLGVLDRREDPEENTYYVLSDELLNLRSIVLAID